jgi:hypothetical protein
MERCCRTQKPYQHANLYPDPNSTYWFAIMEMPAGSVLMLPGRYPHGAVHAALRRCHSRGLRRPYRRNLRHLDSRGCLVPPPRVHVRTSRADRRSHRAFGSSVIDRPVGRGFSHAQSPESATSLRAFGRSRSPVLSRCARRRRTALRSLGMRVGWPGGGGVAAQRG